jgi:hypothetical protein
MRASMYLDVGIIEEIKRLTQQYQKSSSQIIRALIKAGIRVVEKGGIKISGAFIGIDRPFVEIRYKGLKGYKRRFGVRLGSAEHDTRMYTRGRNP